MASPDGVIRVAIAGAAGRMGRETASALSQANGIEVCAAIDRQYVGANLREVAGARAPELTIDDKLVDSLDRYKPSVLVDFTHPAVAAGHAIVALRRGIAPVVGTSGVSNDDLKELAKVSREAQVPAMVVPNFAIGAVLMMRFASLAARWLTDVQIVEMHHAAKVDAPSGTAKRTADMIVDVWQRTLGRTQVKTTATEASLGLSYRGVPIHSVRLKGLVAHQEVMFGGDGELLTIRHDSLDRRSFMAGVELCVRRIWDLDGLVVGLEKLLD